MVVYRALNSFEFISKIYFGEQSNLPVLRVGIQIIL
jgi:hypothetical protein